MSNAIIAARLSAASGHPAMRAATRAAATQYNPESLLEATQPSTSPKASQECGCGRGVSGAPSRSNRCAGTAAITTALQSSPTAWLVSANDNVPRNQTMGEAANAHAMKDGVHTATLGHTITSAMAQTARKHMTHRANWMARAPRSPPNTNPHANNRSDACGIRVK